VKIQPRWVVTTGKQTNKHPLITHFDFMLNATWKATTCLSAASLSDFSILTVMFYKQRLDIRHWTCCWKMYRGELSQFRRNKVGIIRAFVSFLEGPIRAFREFL